MCRLSRCSALHVRRPTTRTNPSARPSVTAQHPLAPGRAIVRHDTPPCSPRRTTSRPQSSQSRQPSSAASRRPPTSTAPLRVHWRRHQCGGVEAPEARLPPRLEVLRRLQRPPAPRAAPVRRHRSVRPASAAGSGWADSRSFGAEVLVRVDAHDRVERCARANGRSCASARTGMHAGRRRPPRRCGARCRRA